MSNTKDPASLPAAERDVLFVAAIAALLAWNLGSMLWTVCRFFVPVPTGDQWDDAYFPEQIRGRLFALHNEHRPTLGRLVGMADWLLGSGRNEINTVFIVACVLLFPVVLFALLRMAGASRQRAAVIGALAMTILTSTEQSQNLLWGFQTAFVGSFLFSICALFTAVVAMQAKGQPAHTILAFSACLVCSFFAVFSLSSGLLVLPAVAILLFTGSASWKLKIPYLLFWAAVYGVYFHGWSKDQGYSPLTALTNVPLLLQYVSIYVGSPFNPGDLRIASWVGAAGLTFLAILTVDAAVKFRSDRGLRLTSAGMVYLALLLYALMIVGSAGMAALGRVRYGLGQAASSRYGMASLTLWTDLVLLCLLNGQLRMDRAGAFFRRLGWDLGVGLSIIVALTQLSYVDKASLDKARGVNGALAYMMGARKDEILQAIYPSSAELASGDMDKRFLSMVSERKSIFTEDWPHELGQPLASWAGHPAPKACNGHIDRRYTMPGESRPMAHLVGWAWDGASGHVPDLVVFTDDTGKVIGFSKPGYPRPDISDAMKDDRVTLGGWEGVAYTDPGKVIHAYGVSTHGRRSYCLMMPVYMGPPMPDYFSHLTSEPTKHAALEAVWQTFQSHPDLQSAFAGDPQSLLMWAIDDAKHGSGYGDMELAPYAADLVALGDQLRHTLPVALEQEAKKRPDARAALQALWIVYLDHRDLQTAFKDNPKGLLLWAIDDAKHGSGYSPKDLGPHAKTLISLAPGA